MSGQWSPLAARHRRQVLLRRLVVMGVLLGVLAAAALLWPRPRAGGLSVTTTAAVEPTGVLRGPVSAVRSGERVCYSITASGTTSVLRFVPGWTADAELGLRDPSGLVVAQPGDTIVLLGRPGRIGSVAGCAVKGRIWTVTTVRNRA